MSARDTGFIKHLGLNQTKIARILGSAQSAVSDGLAKPGDYFDARKLARISTFIEQEGLMNLADFESAKGKYFNDPAAFLEGGGMESNPSSWSFRQLWTLGDNPEEAKEREFAGALMKKRVSDLDVDMVYVVSDISAARRIFYRLSTFFESDESMKVYIFQMEFLRFMPTIRIFDPQAELKAYTRMFDGSFGRLANASVDGVIELFALYGYGVSDRDFEPEVPEPILTPGFSLLCRPNSFREKKFPLEPEPQLGFTGAS